MEPPKRARCKHLALKVNYRLYRERDQSDASSGLEMKSPLPLDFASWLQSRPFWSRLSGLVFLNLKILFPSFFLTTTFCVRDIFCVVMVCTFGIPKQTQHINYYFSRKYRLGALSCMWICLRSFGASLVQAVKESFRIFLFFTFISSRFPSIQNASSF